VFSAPRLRRGWVELRVNLLWRARSPSGLGGAPRRWQRCNARWTAAHRAEGAPRTDQARAKRGPAE